MTLKLERQDWWDLGFAAALCLLPLLAWRSTFDGTGWWTAGVAGVAAGIVVTAGTIAGGGGFGRLAGTMVAAYLLLCGPVAHGGIAVAMIREGLVGSLEGWPMLVAAHPWVDAPGPGLLPLLQLTLLGSVATTVLAMGSRSPAAPLVPAAALFVGAVFTARSEPASDLVHALAFGVLAVAWARQRSRLVEGAAPRRETLAGHATALVPAVAVLAVGATFASLTAGSVDLGSRMVLRGLVPGYAADGLATPLDRFATYTDQPQRSGNVHDLPLLEVGGATEGTRIRFVTLDTYDGERWQPSNGLDPRRADDRFLRIASRIDNPAEGGLIRIGITPQLGWDGPWVPTVGDPTRLEFADGEGDDPRRHLRANLASRTAVMTDGHELDEGDQYTITGHIHDPELTAEVELSDEVDEELHERAAFLDPAVEAWAAGSATPASAVLRTAERLKEAGHYSVDAEELDAGHSEERLGAEFVLAQPTIGNEAHYAAAMALMANRLGVPARVVVGAKVPQSGVIEGRHVTPWVELLGADGQWYILDAEAFTSSRDGGGEESDPSVGEGPEARLFVESPPEEVEQDPPESDEDDEQDEDPNRDEADSSAAADDGATPDGSGWWRWLLVALGLTVVIGVVPAVKWVRRRRRRTRGRPADRYVGAWSELMDHARDLGNRVPAGLTRPAEAGHLGVDGLAPLADRADVMVFGADEPAEAEAEEFWRLVHGELSELRSQVSRVRRVWAFFSPRSLL